MRWHNKFGNIPKIYAGRTYHSQVEADYASYLDLLIRGKEIQSWQAQPQFRLTVNGKKIGYIKPDFLVIGKYGQEEVHEVKGGFATQTPIWHWKWKHLKAEYPQYKFKIITRKDF